MDAPVRTCWRAVMGAARSTTFLSAFVGIFQVTDSLYNFICLYTSFSDLFLHVKNRGLYVPTEK